MYMLKRITTEPRSPLSISVDGPAPQADGDGGFALGGHYQFWPAGSEDGESSFGVSEHTARVIMGDPGLAEHFECEPPLPALDDKAADDPDQGRDHDQDSTTAGWAGGKPGTPEAGDLGKDEHGQPREADHPQAGPGGTKRRGRG